MNRLSAEKSPYLRQAAQQKIDWYPWSDEAFEAARKQNKPVFLSSGAIWCHWCHVMAKECFENDDIVRLLNEKYISVKLDRDERPDIDRRYQGAVSAMGFGGGWPLSVFLTPERTPFFGGTYFPPEDSLNRPGFIKVLTAVAEFYETNKADVSEYSRKVLDSLKQRPQAGGAIGMSVVREAVTDILSRFDTRNGGFGSSPKFPAPGAVEFLLNRHYFLQLESLGYAARKTLESMARGGFHDQLGGGFHRYSVDAEWIVPHFEKMADDNAWHLRNYLDGYAVFGNVSFREVAEGIIGFIRNVLSDPEGGFYASQDADVTPHDEGGYFTWTDDEFRRILSEEEYRVLSLHLFGEKGAMHHNASKKVLCVSADAERIAGQLDLDVRLVAEIIMTGKKKLLEERNRRQAPLVDTTLYTSLNGMLVTSCLKAFRILQDSWLKEFALKSLHRVMHENMADNKLLHTRGIRAVLDDYIHLTDALIAAYEVAGDVRFLNMADNLMELCIRKFWDEDDGGFFDTDSEVLGIRLKTIEDIPHPSANALGVLLLVKLHSMTGKKKYHTSAERTLSAFAAQAKHMGVHAGYFFSAMDAFLHELRLTLHTVPESTLARTALSVFRPYVSFSYAEDKGCVIPCQDTICYEPLHSAEALQEFLRDRRGSKFKT